MKTRFLFPYWCKYLGIACFLAHVPVMHFSDQLGLDYWNTPEGPGLFNSHHLFFMTTTLLMLTGVVLFAFSKEKIEDEQIAQQRMDSLQWAIYVSSILLIIGMAFTTGNDLKDVMRLNIWVPLMIFIIIFRVKMYRNSRYTKEDAI